MNRKFDKMILEMSHNPVEKIYPRSPRYVLNLQDRKILRYAPIPRGNRSFFTDIVNLSETGMAFTVPFLDSPQKNEIIMVEFTTPDGKPMACYAQVRRVQNYRIIEADLFEKNCKIVAVQFTSLKDGQQKVLRDSLDKKFKRHGFHFRRRQVLMKTLWLWKFRRRQFVAALAGAALLVTTALL